jgi:tetratricopeptide (TPR) repeat protein
LIEGSATLRLGLAYSEKGLYDKAISELTQVIKLSDGKPLGMTGLAHAYALAGRREEAQKTLNELLQISKQRYVSATQIAMRISRLFSLLILFSIGLAGSSANVIAQHDTSTPTRLALENEQRVGPYLIRETEKISIDELKLFGIEPFGSNWCE